MNVAPALHTHANVSGVRGIEIVKVLTPAEAEKSVFDPARILLWEADAGGNYAGSFSLSGPRAGRIAVSDPRGASAVKPGDVIRLRSNGSLLSILYRRGSRANTLFATE